MAAAAKSNAPRTLKSTIKLLINAGAAKPAPPVGPALGQAGLNIMAFCKVRINATSRVVTEVGRRRSSEVRTPSETKSLTRRQTIHLHAVNLHECLHVAINSYPRVSSGVCNTALLLFTRQESPTHFPHYIQYSTYSMRPLRTAPLCMQACPK